MLYHRVRLSPPPFGLTKMFIPTRLPTIKDFGDLATNMRLSKELLYKLINYSHLYYSEYKQKKKGGGTRTIMAPSEPMKAVQWWILHNILEPVLPLFLPPFVHGFVPGRNVLSNVQPHAGNIYFLSMDIKDFFPSIKYGKVFTVFRSLGYDKHVSHWLTALCTYNGALPQGAVTSPALSNLVCVQMDRRLQKAANKKGVVYTRYADDLTFSANNPKALVAIYNIAKDILQATGFCINERKTRFMGPARCRHITGLVIGDTGKPGERVIGIGRRQLRIIRAKIHRLATMSTNAKGRDKLQRHVQGWLAYIRSVDINRYNNLLSYIKHLEQRYGKELKLVI